MNKSNCPSFDIKKLCYELYKLDWKREHNITLGMVSDEIKKYQALILAGEFCSDYTFDEYLEEYGFAGKIYVCFDEFLDNEYLEEDYIRKLLDNTNLIALYLQDIYPTPTGKTFKVMCFTQDEFRTLFESIFGKYNVDVDENNALYNEIYLEYETTNINGGIYFCAVSDKDVYARISDKLGIRVTDIHLGQGENGVKDGCVWVVYEQNDNVLVKTPCGVLNAVQSPDKDYPGIDVEYRPNGVSENYSATLPRVRFETADGELRVLIWAKADIDDYTHIIRFE